MRTLQLLAVAAGAAVFAAAVAPVTTTNSSSLQPAASKKKSKKKSYRSSNGKPAPGASSKKPSSGVSAKKKPARPKPTRTRTVPVSVAVRTKAHDVVLEDVASGANIPVENAAALIPFFEQLYRHQSGELMGPLHILHYGDSHTAADEWTGELRARFQEKFGDGGSGYSFAGRPWNGYRREDVRSGSTRGWHTDGLVGRPGDGVYGLGGISMSVRAPREDVYVEAEASEFELFYYQQPGGGSLQLYDNGTPVDRVATDGEAGPAYYHLEAVPGPHRLEVETLDKAPVRLFGWVAEKTTGVTYETLGINGAQASIILDWNAETLRSNIARRNPALIVLSYGTNEAGRKDWTLESYRDMFSHLISRLREASPTATILVIGPPDRDIHSRKGWQPMDAIDMIVEAQRQAALANGCPFWDTRAKMGGKGAMQQWVNAGMAQSDHVHFTGMAYHMLGDAVFRDVMSQYDVFLKARKSIVASAEP